MGVAADHFREVCSDDADRVHHRVSFASGEVRLILPDPYRRQSESRIVGRFPLQSAVRISAGNGQFMALQQLIACNLGAAQLDHIFARSQPDVVLHFHRRHQVSELRGQLSSECR